MLFGKKKVPKEVKAEMKIPEPPMLPPETLEPEGKKEELPKEIVEAMEEPKEEKEVLFKPKIKEEKPKEVEKPKISSMPKLVYEHEPELLRAFAEIISEPITSKVISAIKNGRLSVSEIGEKIKVDANTIEPILKRLSALGILKKAWYVTKSGKHFHKYALANTRGIIEFDLQKLKDTLSVEELDSKTEMLIALVSKEGQVPKTLIKKVLGVKNDAYLEQIIRYCEKFRFKDIRKMISETKPPSEEVSTKEPTIKVRPIHKDIEEIEKYLESL